VNPQQILARLRETYSSLSTPQLLSIAGAFVLAVGLVGGSAWWLNAPDYVLLLDDLEPEAASDIVARLKDQNVQYQLDPGGRAIRVPRERVDELRLEVTGQGMPASGRVGFEIFDRTAFGATEFLEKVNYRRALEGELARTIATLSEVSTARVHIAMGKDSLFGEQRPAKASVVLKLRGNKQMAASTISGITNLVSASVEGLRPDAVVVVDSFGRALARPDEDADDPLGAAQVERQQRLEREMAARVIALLEPVVGPDRARVNVALKLKVQTVEQTEEQYDPNTVIRSRQVSADQANTGGSIAAVAGSRGNMPTPPNAPAPSGTPLNGSGSSRNSETTNFEVSRLTRHSVEPPGAIDRMSVAVILDDDQVLKKDSKGVATLTRVPRNAEELQKLQGVVAAAVGLDTERGDQLTVQNISFEEPPIEEEAPEGVLVRYAPQIQEGSRMLTVVLIALGVFFFVLRPLMRRAGVTRVTVAKPVPAEALAAPAPKLKTVADMESEIEAQLEAVANNKAAENRRLPVLTRRVSQITDKEPANTAKLLRTWMTNEDR
jgi:flagellar M-ring protein FliF